MLKWLLLVCLVGLAYGHPGVYDEYTYSEEDKEGEGGMYLYYDDDEAEEEDIDDELLKKITDEIANTSYEEEKPKKGARGMKKNKRPKRSAGDDTTPEEDEAVELTSRKKKSKFSFKVSNNKRVLKLSLKPALVIKDVAKSYPKPLNKNQRDQIKGGFMGWQYSMLNDDSCLCKEDNKCTCCSSAQTSSAVCVDFVAEPKRVQVSMDIGTQRHIGITIAENSKSMSCEHLNIIKDICIYSYGFTPSDKGYKACAIITNNVKDPKAGVLKCINFNDGKASISDE